MAPFKNNTMQPFQKITRRTIASQILQLLLYPLISYIKLICGLTKGTSSTLQGQGTCVTTVIHLFDLSLSQSQAGTEGKRCVVPLFFPSGKRHHNHNISHFIPLETIHSVQHVQRLWGAYASCRAGNLESNLQQSFICVSYRTRRWQQSWHRWQQMSLVPNSWCCHAMIKCAQTRWGNKNLCCKTKRSSFKSWKSSEHPMFLRINSKKLETWYLDSKMKRYMQL